MPLHRIYAPPGVLTPADKRQLAHDIAEHYASRGLPPFLVVTLFFDVEAEDYYIGFQNHAERAKEQGKPFVRIVSQHLARTWTTKEMRTKGTKGLEETFRKVIEAKGCEWEIHIEEPPADLWRLSGYEYPAPRTDAEAKWKEANHPVPYEGPTMADHLDQQQHKSS